MDPDCGSGVHGRAQPLAVTLAETCSLNIE